MKAVHRALSDDRAFSLLELIGDARNILVIGEGREELLRALDAGGCTVSCALIGSGNPDEARVFCSQVFELGPEATELPKAFRNRRYDVALFDGSLERLTKPAAILLDARSLLEPSGAVVASIRNILHGSIRLAVVAGKVPVGRQSGDPIMPLDAKTANALFADARLAVTQIEYDRQPVFGENGAALGLRRTDFSRSLVEEIEKDPRSEVFQFFVKAHVHETAVSLPIGELPPVESFGQALLMPVADLVTAELRSELDGERATRERLLAALADLTANNAMLQARVAQLAERRRQHEGAAVARQSELDALHAALEAYKEERLRLKLALSLSYVALKRSGQELELAESAWYALYDELSELREQDATSKANHLHHVASLESRVGDLELEAAWKQQQLDEAASYARHLNEELEAVRRASLSETAVMRQYAQDARERTLDLESQMRAFAEREQEMACQEAELRERLAESELRLGDENRELRDRVADAERALAAHTDAVVVKMQAESAQLSKLVDTVQASHFWRFKRWLNRLRGGSAL